MSDDEEEEEEEEEPHYLSLLRQIQQTREYSINLNCRHLWNYLPARRLYHVITHYPQETVSFMDKVINDEYVRLTHTRRAATRARVLSRRAARRREFLLAGEEVPEGWWEENDEVAVEEALVGEAVMEGEGDGRRIQVCVFECVCLCA